jgi:hypothetical protein
MDLLGLANLMKAIVAVEWIGRKAKIIFTDKKNLANIKGGKDGWKPETMAGEWNNAEHSHIIKSRLLSLIAGVSLLYDKAMNITKFCHDKKLPTDSTNFWLETVRFYNYGQTPGGSIDTNIINYNWMNSVLFYTKKGDSRRNPQIEKYQSWLKEVKDGNVTPLL